MTDANALPPPSTAPKIDVQALLKQAWELFLAAPVQHVLAFLVLCVGGGITLGLAAGPLLVGYLRLVDKQTKGESFSVGNILDGLNDFAPALVAWIVLTGGVILGTMFIVLPGAIVLFVWSYCLWFVAIKNQSATEALRSSWNLVKTDPGSVLLILVVVVGMNFIGGLCVVGVLVTAPISLIFMTLGFNRIAT